MPAALCETVSVPAAQTELASAAGAAPPVRSPGAVVPPRPPAQAARPPRQALWWPTLLVAAVLCAVTFYAKGGLNFEFNLEPVTTTEIALTLGAGVVVAAAVLLTPAGRPVYGLWPVGLLLAFTALTAMSVVWSVQPDNSWQDAGRMFAFSGVFGATVALVRLSPERWPAILGGLALAAVVVCGYALLSKIFPDQLARSNIYARLEAPYGYWNALGLTAAMGSICCLWLGARRTGHALLSALAYPAMGLLLLTLLLAYSRGAVAALAVGLLAWFCTVPLRLRGAAVLILGALGAGAVAAWDFSRHALSAENVALGARTAAGHQLGVLLAAMLLLLLAAGIAIGFLTGRRAPPPALRRHAGMALLGLIVLAVIASAGALAHSQRGLTGSVSNAVNTLTNPDAKPPPNTPGRLTAVASVRARYWKEALQIFDAHPLLGVGASGYATAQLRYRTAAIEVKNAHGFIVQTLADLGAVGLALALALLLTWMAAAGRPTHPFNRRWTSWRSWLQIRSGARPGWRRLSGGSLTEYTPERIGMLTMLCVVIVFGVHSFVDWTWYVPGVACATLLCAGWLAGRGPLSVAPQRPLSVASQRPGQAQEAPSEPGLTVPGLTTPDPATPDPTAPAQAGARAPARDQLSPIRLAVASAAIVAAVLAAWSQWQPQRSVKASQEALALVARNPTAALAAAQTGVARDPLSVQALFTLATVEQAAGHGAQARATLQQAVRLQPSNPQSWLALARHDLASNPRAAVSELQAAIYLNPESIAPEALAKEREALEIHNDYIQALQASAALAAPRSRPAFRSASGSRARAELDARRAARRLRAPRLAGSRSPRAAG